MAFVILRAGHEASSELQEALREQVASQLGKSLRPKAVHVVPDLPRTRNAKIMRRVIRATYIGEPPGDLSSLENPAAVDALAALRQ